MQYKNYMLLGNFKSYIKKESFGFIEKFEKKIFILFFVFACFFLFTGSVTAWEDGEYNKNDFNVINAGPNNYTDIVNNLEAGDWMALESGTYTDSIYPDNLQGTKENPIVISGPEDDGEVVLERHGYANTIEFGNSHNLVIRNIRLDGSTNDVGMAIRARHNSFTSNITLENLYIHDYDYGSRTAIDTSNDAVAFGWTIRNVTIDGASTGMYFGCASGEDGAFIGATIEDNVVKDTSGYNIQIKHQNHRDFDYEIPEGPHETIIRNNIFKRAGHQRFRPNLLLGHFPEQGTGSEDMYLVYGNTFYENEGGHRNVQTDSTAAFYNNLFINTKGGGIFAFDHNDNPKDIYIYRNTFLTDGTAINVQDVDSDYEQVVKGNAIFSDDPYSLDDNVIEENNFEADYNYKDDYLKNPDTSQIEEIDLRPIGDALNKEKIEYENNLILPDFENDFKGNLREQATFGAYAGVKEKNKYTLTIVTEGEGTTEPAKGSHVYDESEELVVEAKPSQDWKFFGWDGDYKGTEKEITITMNDSKELIAVFKEAEFDLNIDIPQEGDVYGLDEIVIIGYTLNNTGEVEVSQDTSFFVDSEKIDKIEDVTLDSGEVYVDEFIWMPEEPGEYELKVKTEETSYTINIIVKCFEQLPTQKPKINFYYPYYNPIIFNDEEQEFYIEVNNPEGKDYFVEWYLNEDKVGTGNSYTYKGDEKSGKYNHQIKFTTTNLTRDASITWSLTQADYPVTNELDGDTTEFSKIDNLSKVKNLTFEKSSKGKIFFGNSSVNLSGIANIEQFIRMEKGVFGLDSKSIETFNQPATIVMYGLDYPITPKIYYSDDFEKNKEEITKECPKEKCFNLNYNADKGILSFDVSNFSVFKTAVEPEETLKKDKKDSRPVQVPHLRFVEESVRVGDDAVLHLNLENYHKGDLGGLRVRMGIPELGIYRTKGPFDLDLNDNVYRRINLRIPEYASPGIYTARITVTDSNNEVRRTIHRDLIVD